MRWRERPRQVEPARVLHQRQLGPSDLDRAQVDVPAQERARREPDVDACHAAHELPVGIGEGDVLQRHPIAAEREPLHGDRPGQRRVHPRQRDAPDQLAALTGLQEGPGDGDEEHDRRQHPHRGLPGDAHHLRERPHQNASPIATWNAHIVSGTGVVTFDPNSPKQLSFATYGTCTIAPSPRPPRAAAAGRRTAAGAPGRRGWARWA